MEVTTGEQTAAAGSFFAGKRVLVTGHTGFKGSWLSLWLTQLGAEVHGLALIPDTTPALFDQLGLAGMVDHAIGDIRDAALVDARVRAVQPDLVFHLAAQPLVLESYADPLTTWQTNVMGTVHLMQALRDLGRPCAAVMITTDKVYQNREWHHPYRECDPLGGHDPYSASKAAMEIAVASWRDSFLTADHPVRIATARAGNVIGGGDWAANRLVPDIMRALGAGHRVDLRNPDAVRPWQHVLEPLAGYLRLAERLAGAQGAQYAQSYNFGPEPRDLRRVRDLVEAALGLWPGSWADMSRPDQPHEAGLLSLSIEQARADLGFAPRWDFEQTIARTVEWYRGVAQGRDPRALTLAQIADFGAP